MAEMDPEVETIGMGLRLPKAGKIRVAAYMLSAAGFLDESRRTYDLGHEVSFDQAMPWRTLSALQFEVT